MLIATLSLAIYDHFWNKERVKLNAKQIWKLMGIGVIVAIHWFFFYHSIKNSTIAIALVCLSSTALFTTFLSPIFNKKDSFSWLNLLTGLVIMLGIALIFNFESGYKAGIIYGLIAALSAALFTILNEIEVQGIPASTIGKYEMLGGFLAISVYLGLSASEANYHFALSASDLIYLLILGTVCTAFAYVMGVAVMKELSAFTVVLITNLEPVYGIVLGLLIFGDRELMSPGFYQGAALIMGTVFSYPFIRNWLQARK